jgi:hypothetical protein
MGCFLGSPLEGGQGGVNGSQDNNSLQSGTKDAFERSTQPQHPQRGIIVESNQEKTGKRVPVSPSKTN